MNKVILFNMKFTKISVRRLGFTLIELLVVISIITLLSSIIITSVSKAREKAQISSVSSSMEEIVKALEIYRTSHGYYPKCMNDSGNPVVSGCWRDQNGVDGYFYSSSNSLMQQLKNDKVLSSNFFNNVPGFMYLSVVYNDKSDYDAYVSSGHTPGWDNYMNWVDLSSTYIFSGKTAKSLSEYVFCVMINDNRSGTNLYPIAINSQNFTKNVISGTGYLYYMYCAGN